MISQKQGVSSEFFVWIFALVAGALLFLFFVLWSGNHATTSTQVEDLRFLNSFEQQLRGLSSGNELSKTLTFPPTSDVHFLCDTLYTGNTQVHHDLFLFSQPTLSSSKYTLFGEPWNFPFYLDTFYYLLPQGHTTLIYYEPSAASFVSSLSPPPTLSFMLFPMASYSLPSLQQQIQGPVTLVFFGPIPDATALLRAFPSATLLSVHLEDHTLTFYPSEKTYPYYGDAFLFGAFFGPEVYSCLQQKGLSRLSSLAILYQQKTLLLQQKLGAADTCAPLLTEASSLLASLTSLTETELIYATVTSLTSLQEELLYHDCQTIF